ncbi:Sec-independent protein translocase protein TatB [Lysobacter tyrosinilyticus]
MFDVGFGELFMIAIVALLVLGPERLPKAARFAGLWVRRARAQWYSVKAELENELADDELRRSLRQTQADLKEARDSLAQGGVALQQQIQQARTDMRNAFLTDNPGHDSGAGAEAPATTDAIPTQPQLPIAEHTDEHAATTEHAHPAESGPDARR